MRNFASLSKSPDSLRWEVQFPFTALNNNYAQTSLAGLFGVSGPGKLFKPGTLTGQPTQFTEFKVGDKAFNTDYNNLAPSFGIAWSPSWKNGWLRRLLGASGESVFRAGYSIAFNREGMNVVSSILGANPGGQVSASRNIVLGNLTPGTLFRNRENLGPPIFPTSPTFPLTGTITDSANAFVPDLRLGYVQSWTFGLQREITKEMIFEARYVGNRGVKLWRRYDLNEINTIENGFLNEFKLAQANLAANLAANRGNTFAYFGPGSGTSPLPMTLAYFSGIPLAQAGDPARYNSPLFSSPAFYLLLSRDHPFVQGFAASLFGNPGRRSNAAAAGLPGNLFVVNPDKLGGAFIVDNGGRTSYDALVLELRRRLSRGLLLQGSYTFCKALTNMFASSATVLSQYSTLRNPALNKTSSPFDITHSFKANWIYELPLGRGKTIWGNAGRALDRFIGGWEFHGTSRIQSGTPFNFGNVQLVNLTRNQLQDLVEIRKEPNKIVFYLPDDFILNTRRAFNATQSGFSALGAPSGRYVAPASGRACVEGYVGQCGFTYLVLHGPQFTRFDLSLVKKTRISERVNFEFRAEFLNAFNHINFSVGNAANDVTNVSNFGSPTFGQITNAYRDLSTTNDPGGRLVQFVARINF